MSPEDLNEIETPAQSHAYEPTVDIGTTPFPYPGNKSRLAEWVLRNTIDHERWVAPFGGAGGILFNKTPSRNEVLNDINGDVITFYRVLRDRRDELKEYLSLIPYHEEQYREWKQKWDKEWRPDDEVKHAGVFYFLQRASFGGAQTGFRCVVDGRKNSSQQYFNSLDRLDAFSERLEGVVLHNCDYVEMFDKYADDSGTFFYIDAPYDASTYDFDTNPMRFSQQLGRLSGKTCHFMMSGITVPMTIGCYPTVETDLTHQISNEGGSKEVTEKLVMSYRPDNREMFAQEAKITEYA